MKEIGGLSEGMARYAGLRTVDPAAMKQEGATHAGVLMQALAKLEVKKGLVYRGARMSQQEFDATYGSRSQLTYNSFVSSSIRELPAANYAAGGGTKRPRADQTVSVKCIFEVDDARDVKVLSEVTSEDEWLLMPGATFTITRIDDEANGVPGSPPATAWKVVHLKQIKRPPYQAKPPAADTAKPGSPPDLSSPAAQALAKLGRGDFTAPGKQPAAPAGPSSAQALAKLGRRDFRVR